MKSIRLLLCFILSSGAFAGIGNRSPGWKKGQTIHIEVIGANAADMACLNHVTSEISSFANIKFKAFRQEEPIRTLIQAELTIVRPTPEDNESGHSHVGNAIFRREKVVLRLRDLSSERIPMLYCDFSTIRHELGHLLGLTHEHQHPDVPGVILDKIQSEDSAVSWNEYGRVLSFDPTLRITKYDPLSVMHYPYRFTGVMAQQLIMQNQFNSKNLGVLVDDKNLAVKYAPLPSVDVCSMISTMNGKCYRYSRLILGDDSSSFYVSMYREYSAGDKEILAKMYPFK